MIMRNIKVVVLLLVFLVSTSLLFANEEKERTAKGPRQEWTAPELLEYIKETLRQEEEILSYIPELKKGKDEKGETFYIYDGVGLEMSTIN